MSMNPLHTLSSAALIGTDRRAPEWPAFEGELGALVRQVSAEAANGQAFLRVAGVLGACHLAGRNQPLSSREAPAVCPEETLKVMQDASVVQALTGILVDGPMRLQAEAFQVLAKHGCGLPHRLLPKALDAGRRSIVLRESLLPVLGQRGAWLAAQQADWGYAAGAGGDNLAEESWEHGSLDQRKLFLRKLRAVDPARARALVQLAMPVEGAKERAVLLEELHAGLSLEDEELIESALKDKSKEVRETASRLLGAMPGSRFTLRMAARLDACLKIEKKFLRGEVITIEPPATHDPEWKHDLISETPPQGSKIGQRAWWLLQITTRAPLGWWVERTGKAPAELIEWARKTEWKDALTSGWVYAQHFQKLPEWSKAMLEAEHFEGTNQNPFDWLLSLPTAERERQYVPLIISRLKAKSAMSFLLERLLETIPPGATIASAEVGRELLRLVRERIHSGAAQHDWQLRGPLVELVCVLPPSLLDEAVANWDLQRPEVMPFAEAVARLSVVAEQRKLLHALRP